MKKYIALVIAFSIVLSCGIVEANAADYTFKEKNNDDFYHSTLYADIYGSEYNYGGQNVTDFYDTSKLPGLISPTPQTAKPDGTVYGTAGSYSVTSTYDASADYSGGFTSYNTSWETSYTSVSDLKRSDGSIGTIYIPSLSISRKVYEGTSDDSMAKGLGHFPDTSAWNGNISLCGHNRGTAYAIGGIRNLRTGDTIEYTTLLGTREYSVTFVGTISNSDWSYLSPTNDNRITIITCLNDQPSLRVCVQAVEKR